MLNYKISSTNKTCKENIKKMALELKQPQISFIVFFASAKFKFEEVNDVFKACYPDHIVLGGTSQGEWADGKYNEGYLTAISIYGDDFKVEPVVLEEISRKGMIYKNKVQAAIEKLGIRLSDSKAIEQFFGLSLLDGMSMAEEKVMTMLGMVFEDKPIRMVGGSCGSLDSAECYLSLNGKVYQDAAILLFVRTNKKIVLYNENIYEPFGATHRITSSRIGERIVQTADNVPMTKLYQQTFNVREQDLDMQLFAKHPIARMQGDKAYIASPVNALNTGAIKFYTRVMPGSSFRFMNAVDPLERAKQTAAYIKENLNNPKLILGFSCILRYIQFKEQNLSRAMYEILNEVAPAYGFTTLGEQIGLTQVNQTLTLLAIED